MGAENKISLLRSLCSEGDSVGTGQSKLQAGCQEQGDPMGIERFACGFLGEWFCWAGRINTCLASPNPRVQVFGAAKGQKNRGDSSGCLIGLPLVL